MKWYKNFTTRQKHWIFFSLTAVGSIVIVNLAIWLMWTDLTAAERVFGKQIFGRVITYGTMAMGVVFFISSQFILYIFNNYISPIEQLAEETRLIAVANAKYRIKPIGASETHNLIKVINELADSYIDLKTEVKNIVNTSREGFDAEKKRLHTLMNQIPEGVVICNYDGRILNYNQQATLIFELHNTIETATKEQKGMLGKGRSIFGICHRNPIVFGLNYLQEKLDAGSEITCFKFITTRKAQFLRTSIAPILEERKKEKIITGYVLTFSDITNEVKANKTQRNQLENVIIELQKQLENLKKTATYFKEGTTEREELEKIKTGLTTTIKATENSSERIISTEKEYMLIGEFIDLFKAEIVDKFNVKIETQLENGLWLAVNSYELIRATTLFLSKLLAEIKIEKLKLSIIRKQELAYLQLRWEEGNMPISIIEQWKKTPLFESSEVLKNMDLNSDLLLKKQNQISSVRFPISVQKPKANWKLKNSKKAKTLTYNFDALASNRQVSTFDDIPLKELPFVVFDTETTGVSPSLGDEIISIGGVRIYQTKIQTEETFDQLIDPQRNIPIESLKIHGIEPKMLQNKPVIDKVLPVFHQFAENAVLVAHNAAFDMKFLQLKEEQTGVRFNNPVLDTLLLSAVCNPSQELHNLEDIAQKCGVEITGRHTALGDALVTAEVFLKLIPILEAKGISTLKQAQEASRNTPYSNLKF